jgi:hypothetical protein
LLLSPPAMPPPASPIKADCNPAAACAFMPYGNQGADAPCGSTISIPT